MLDHIQKHRAQMLGVYSNAEELIKGKGAGSRGGKVIGHTKSGKPIYDTHDHPEHKQFTSQDHRDAADLHHDRANQPGSFPGHARAQRNKHHDAAIQAKGKEDKAALKAQPKAGDKITTKDGVSGDVKHRDETHTYLEHKTEDGKTRVSKVANEEVDAKIKAGHFTHHAPTNDPKEEKTEKVGGATRPKEAKPKAEKMSNYDKFVQKQKAGAFDGKGNGAMGDDDETDLDKKEKKDAPYGRTADGKRKAGLENPSKKDLAGSQEATKGLHKDIQDHPNAPEIAKHTQALATAINDDIVENYGGDMDDWAEHGMDSPNADIEKIWDDLYNSVDKNKPEGKDPEDMWQNQKDEAMKIAKTFLKKSEDPLDIVKSHQSHISNQIANTFKK